MKLLNLLAKFVTTSCSIVPAQIPFVTKAKHKRNSPFFFAL